MEITNRVKDILKVKIKIKTKNRSTIFFALSLLVHILFIFIIYIFSTNINLTPEPKKMITISLKDKAEIQKLLAKVKNKESKINPSKKLQIVNNQLNGMDERPSDTRFLGEKNQNFDRQTIAKNVDIFNKPALGGANSQQKEKVAKTEKKSPSKINKKSELNDLGQLAFNKKKFEEFDSFKMDPIKELKKLGTEKGDISGSGLAANNDFIEDVPLGDVTNLNTVEFKHFGFYSRIRKKLEQHWTSMLREKSKQLYKSGRKLIEGENYITSLRITIDDKGNIVSVFILSSSGQQELDSAAVESFNKSGPFPNPPKGMLKNGVAVLEWGFVVKS